MNNKDRIERAGILTAILAIAAGLAWATYNLTLGHHGETPQGAWYVAEHARAQLILLLTASGLGIAALAALARLLLAVRRPVGA